MAGVFLIDGAAHPAALLPHAADSAAIVAADGDRFWVHLDGRTVELVWRDALTHHAGAGEDGSSDQVRAPMPGQVLAVAVAPGSAVAKGDALMVIESMKLETVLKAPRHGIVEAIGAAVGQSFERDRVLVTLAAEPSA